MHTSVHTLNELFSQLGLPSGDQDIHQFVKDHTLRPHTKLYKADFWTPSQSGFIKESWQDDSEWCQPIDYLDTLLRH
ncbi:DUF2789 domain-containing protein [Parendozoicomonas haliclonae]|uniref:DUF2789 domain-containing protein n=1 Tax=Parendozoicomonas haliclonae TaxID=1960125 RepID=A0A1X7AE75_9GAMM|nr:DUF2789 domain-containing protein [Parendozoicomonas haliclonae]SMA32653.1 hypothetical protein EHSB41UT_00174 [Parendozoicomonas haliclonae]